MNWKKILRPSFLTDKETHSLYGTLFFISSCIFFNIHLSFLFTTLLAGGVEFYDFYSKKGNAEWLDFIYTIIIPFFIYVTILIN
jgi:hypothetical protein